MKRFCACLLVIIMLVSLLPASGLAQTVRDRTSVFAGGDGSKENPYLVSTPEQLDAVRQNLSAHYLQINDIDLSGWDNWEPIGTGLSLVATAGEYWPAEPEPFTGSYNGGNYKITNLKIHDTDASIENDCLGLFGGADNAQLKNIHLEGLWIFADRADDDYAMIYENCGDAWLFIGGICGRADDSYITDCTVSGQITVTNGCNTYAGGIVGAYAKQIAGCVSNTSMDIHANKNYHDDQYSGPSGTFVCAGGIIGYAKKCGIELCANSGALRLMAGKSSIGGGICGTLDDGSIRNCANYAPIRCDIDLAVDYWISTSTYAGGIVATFYAGYMEGISIEYCVNYGTILCQNKTRRFYDHAYISAGGIAASGKAEPNEENAWLYGCVNLAPSIDTLLVDETNTISYVDACKRIIGYYYGRMLDCASLDQTLINGQTHTGSEDRDDYYYCPQGTSMTAQQLLQENAYPGYDFKENWVIDSQAGGAVLQTLDKVQVPQLAIEISSVKLVENIVDNPIEGIYQYEIRAQFHNTSKTEIKDMVAELSVYDGLSLASGERPQFVLADLPADGVTWATWIVNAPWPEDDVNVQFKVSVTVGDAVRVEKDGLLTLSPPLTYTDIHGWPLLNWIHSFGYPDGEYRVPFPRYNETFGISFTTACAELAQDIGDIFGGWPGNCFGLSLLSLAHYYGIIDIAPYFTTPGQTLNEFGYEGIYTDKKGNSCYTVAGNQRVTELIERAQISQISVEIKKVEMFKGDHDFFDLIDFLNSAEARPIMVTTCKHTMVITTDFKPYVLTDGVWAGWIVLPLYDPNAPTVGDELPNPMDYYKWGRSYLLLNIETSEWAYSCNEKVKEEGDNDNPLSRLQFYDVAALEPSYFNRTLNVFYTNYKIQFRGANARLEDAEGNILFEMEDGQIVRISEDCEIEKILGAEDGATPACTICTNVKNLQIVSEDALVIVLQEGSMHVLQMDGAYTVSLGGKAGTLKINSQQTGGEFVVYSQDWDGHGAKITGQHRKGNCVTIRQNGAEIRVTTVDADANIAYECENIAEEDMTVALASKKDDKEPDEGMFDFENVIWIVGAVILVAAVVGVAWILVRRNKKKNNTPPNAL